MRLRNIEHTPWASIVVTEGDAGDHRAIAADGPVTVVDRPPGEVLAAWQAKHDSQADWASAWFEVRPRRLFSYSAEKARRAGS